MMIKRKLYHLMGLLLLLTVVMLGTAVSNRPAQAAGAAVGARQSAIDPRFGAIESFWAPQEAAELGVGWERILFYWNEIQPNGPGDWNTLHVREEWLTEANAQGRQVVGLLKNTPNWATDGEFASGVPNGLYLPVNDPGNLWANYVRRVAQYYGPLGVHNWIVWNEPDIAPNVYGHEFSGSIQDYYQLLKVAYIVMKQVDPTAKIHMGGMTYWHDPGYLRRFLEVVVADPEAAANNYYFDVISLHIYFRPETMTTIVGSAFAVQKQVGIEPLKAVWVNETNARPSTDPEWPVQVQAFDIDLEQQAWFIPQAFSLGFYSGAARISVYKLVDINIAPGDESWGLIRPYDFSKRPAFNAYKNTIRYLSGFTYPIQREQGSNYFIVTFPRPQGTTRVLWARSAAAVTLQVPAIADAGVLVDSITGAETPVTAVGGAYEITLAGARCNGECLIGGPPVFLVEDETAAGALPPAPTPDVTEPTAAPEVTTTVTVTATTAVSSTATLPEPTATLTPTLTPTASATATPEPTATVTNTAVPTATASATVVPTEIAQGETAVPVDRNESNVVTAETPSFSWWFLGAGGVLAAILGVIWFRRR